MEFDCIVIGAGLSGLTTSRELERAGRSVLLIESSDDVGGRVRSDQIDGYICDRGFQVINPKYPQVAKSGVWIRDSKGDRKIAAIGLRVAKGVTMHGFALNVNPDLSAYSKIIPCGITDAKVTSLAVELDQKIDIQEVIPVLKNHLCPMLERVSK